MGEARDYVHIDGTGIRGALTVNMGAGDDMVAFDAYDVGSLTGSVFGGPVTVILGAGDDIVASGVRGAGNSAVYEGKVTVNGGSGEDIFEYLAGDNTFAKEPKVTGIEVRA